MALTLRTAIKKTRAYELGIAHALVVKNDNDFRGRTLKAYGLNSIEWFVLGIVQSKTAKGGIRVTDLAILLEVKTTYITATLNALRQKGHIVTKTDSHDARVRLIIATKKGEKSITSINEQLQKDLEEQLRNKVTGEQFESYVYVLRELNRSPEL